MDDLSTYRISGIPYKGLKKVSDLLTFDGNIVLSHFTDESKNEFLLYWVDYSKDLNRWLISKISKDHLFQYLNGAITLKEILLDGIEKEFLFIVDQDLDSICQFAYLLPVDQIPIDYLPETESLYSYSIPIAYTEYFREFTYLNILREKALFFTLKASSPTFGNTVGVKDAADFLNGIYKSYNEYSEYDFFNSFKNNISDPQRLQKTYTSLQDSRSLRICDMTYSSFNVALATDTINIPPNTDLIYSNWKKEIVQKYTNEVIDNDFDSDTDASIIIEKFPDPELRKRIFEPIIKILESPNVSLDVKSFDKKFHRHYKKINKQIKDRLIPKPTIEMLEEQLFPERKLVQMIVEIPKNEDVGNISKKGLKDGLLFAQETNEFPIMFDKIEYGGTILNLSKQLELVCTFNQGRYQLKNDVLGINVITDTRENLKLMFEKEFVKIYFETLSENNPYKEEYKKLVISNNTIPDEEYF